MGVDWSNVVLKPCQDAFGIPVVVDPRRSRREAPIPYTARGIWTQRESNIVLEGSGLLSDLITTLDVRIAEFTIPPVAQDYVVVNGIEYFIDDVQDDGQGNRRCTLKRTTEPI